VLSFLIDVLEQNRRRRTQAQGLRRLLEKMS
jgi:hypothetical protein